MRAGFVALVGRPNVGKSTLLNQILGEKLAIATPRPQTTRERLLGVFNRPGLQVGFVDTPGLHRPSGPGRTKLNQYMVDQAKQAIADVDAVVVLIELEYPELPKHRERDRNPKKPAAPAKKPQRPDPRLDPATLAVLEEVKAVGRPTILCINKVDELKDKRQLLPILEQVNKMGFAAMVPISAKVGNNVDQLLAEIEKIVPEGDPLFDEDVLTDRSERWFATEFVREQIFLLTKREIPYSVAVTIDEFEEKAPGPRTKTGDRELRVSATISVDKEAHKRIVVGEGGRMIREIGSRARHELGQRFGALVHLTLFVRVDEGWTQNPHKMRELGYEG